MIWVNVKLALASIKSAKLRSFLTMVAVIIGVAAFTIITTMVEGLRESFTTQINDFGGNLVTVNSGKIFDRDESGNITDINFAAGLVPTLTEQDFADIQEIEGIRAAAPIAPVSGIVRRGEKKSDAFIIATNESYPDALSQEIATGSFLKAEDVSRNNVVIGPHVAEEFYSNNAGLGSTLTIGGEKFVVIGIMEEQEASGLGFGPDINNAVFISLEAGRNLSSGTLLISEIDIQAEETEDVDALVKKIEETLLPNHGGEANFAVAKQDELVQVFNGFIDILKSASQVISYIMLFVGGVVILLIMLITVTERTREIGIRKSIGATNGNILVQFITEAVVLTLIGSLIGLVLAYILGLVVSTQVDITPVYNVQSLLAIVAIGTIIGALAGLYPAMQAARKDPVEALRHE